MQLDQTYQINKHKSVSIPPAALCRVYGTTINYDETLQVHFETELSMLGGFENKGYLYLVNKKQVYINNKKPRLLIDKLADEMGKALYPVLLVVNHSGELQAIINFEDIQKRWYQAKQQMEPYYQGKIIQGIVARMDAALQQEARVTAALKKDWFIAAFFSGIHSNKAAGFELNPDFLFPLVPYGPMVKYTATGDLLNRNTESKTFILQYTGTVNEERSAEDIENKNPAPLQELLFANSTKAAGHLHIRYNMYHKDHSARSVQGTMSLALPGGEKKIRLGIFHQQDKDRPLKDIITLEAPQKRKENFFKSLLS